VHVVSAPPEPVPPGLMIDEPPLPVPPANALFAATWQ